MVAEILPLQPRWLSACQMTNEHLAVWGNLVEAFS